MNIYSLFFSIRKRGQVRTMKKGIISRDKCPICNSTSLKIIFNRSFNEELIKEYMNVAYQGNADIEFLEDITFEIVKCSECNLL